jgi:hypothetical protein
MGSTTRKVMAWLTLVAATLATVAAAQPFDGTYDGTTGAGGVQLTLVTQGGEVAGTLTGTGIHFELEGEVDGDAAYGYAATAGGVVGFEAYVQGDLLGLYLFELDAFGNPLPQTAIEVVFTRRSATGATGAARDPDDAVVAIGRYASLTQRNAEAFLDALEFVLTEIGYASRFTPAERQRALASLAAAFPGVDQPDQVVLADAAAIWRRVQANWPRATLDERREFALGVLVLAFGEETVRAWAGPSGASRPPGPGGTCGSFEDCTGRLVDEGTWTETFNSQSCWAAAGCSGYSDGTFSYDSPE